MYYSADLTFPDDASEVEEYHMGIHNFGGRWNISSGDLPPGLEIGYETGTIAGTPEKAGIYDFTVFVSYKDASNVYKTDAEIYYEATKDFRITIYDDPSKATSDIKDDSTTETEKTTDTTKDESSSTESTKTSSSSGGCNTGLGVLGLVVLAAVVSKRMK